MNELHKSDRLAWALLTAFAIVSLYLLGVRTLVPPDEGRYAEIAREMFVSGDWITTRLNGIKYFEKPPLQAWMSALAFTVFGLGEWQARLWTGLCGLLGVAVTGYAGARVFDRRVGFYAALVLGSSFFWVACSQVASLDMSLAAMMGLTLCALLLAQHDGASAAERRAWMLASWAGMALAVLSKGLVGVVLPGAVLVVYTLIARDWGLWRRLHPGLGLPLMLAIAAPWFVLVARANPEQPHFFFIHEHLERFLSSGHRREGAWYYFFGVLAGGIAPWLGVLPQSLALGATGDTGRFRPRLLLLVWAVLIFVFFSVSHSKLPGYILPIFPALALLIGAYLEAGTRRSRMFAAGLTAAIGVLLLVLVPLMPKLVRFPDAAGELEAYQPWVLAAGFAALAGGALALLHARQLRRDLMVLTLALAGFILAGSILVGFERYGQLRAGTALIPAIKAELKPDTRIYSIGTYEQSLTWYLERSVILVAYRDEFGFGLDQQPELAIAQMQAFVGQWTRDAAAGVRDLGIVRADIYNQLKQQGVPMRVVAQDKRRIVIANI